MEHDILYSPDSTMIRFRLRAGEKIRAESDAMLGMSDGLKMETGLGAGKNSGGILKNLMRSFLTRESFFTNIFTATSDGQEILFAPKLLGDIVLVPLNNSSLVIQSGSYFLSSPEISLETSWQGMKGFFSGESVFMMRASGSGFVVLSAFGGMQKIAVDGHYSIDTGHIVAFTSGLNYTIAAASKSLFSTFFSGEGLVCDFTGKGDLYIQSRSPVEYGNAVGPKLNPVVRYEN